MVLLKLHCDVTEATLSAFEARVRGGRGGGSPIRLTEPPAETTCLAVVKSVCAFVQDITLIQMPYVNEAFCNNRNRH